MSWFGWKDVAWNVKRIPKNSRKMRKIILRAQIADPLISVFAISESR
jgi:hypothetical protein